MMFVKIACVVLLSVGGTKAPRQPVQEVADLVATDIDYDTSASRLVYTPIHWPDDGTLTRLDFTEYLATLVENGASDLMLQYDHGLTLTDGATAVVTLNNSSSACKVWERLSITDRTKIKEDLGHYHSRIYMSINIGAKGSEKLLDLDPGEYASNFCLKAEELLYDGVNFDYRVPGVAATMVELQLVEWWRKVARACTSYVEFVVTSFPHCYVEEYGVEILKEPAANEKFIVEYFGSSARYDSYRQIFEHDSALHASVKELNEKSGGVLDHKIIVGKYVYKYGHDGTLNPNYLTTDEITGKILRPAIHAGWYHEGVSVFRAPSPHEEYGDFVTSDLKKFAGVKVHGMRPKSPRDTVHDLVAVPIEPVMVEASTTEESTQALHGPVAIEGCRKKMAEAVPTFWLDFCQQMCTLMGSNPDSCGSYDSLFDCINGKGASCKGAVPAS